jgi:hypothetical protein
MAVIAPIVAFVLVFAPAQRTAITVQVAPPPPQVVTAPDGSRCGEWFATALEVGWPVEQWPTVDYVMHRESRCREHAVGPLYRGKHALGLMQLLGWSCPPDGCLDGRSNLAKALELWQSSGWRPWCFDGDPVTGSC